MAAPVTVRKPADVETACPKCGEVNRPRVTMVWFIIDERGPHIECDVCTHMWAVQR